MDFRTAVANVEMIQKQMGFPALLETLEWMRDNEENVTHNEWLSYRVVVNNMAKLFAPA